MHKAAPTRLTDWIMITIRWVFLAGIGLWLFLSIGFILPVIILLVVATLANLLATALAWTKRSTPTFRLSSIAGDMLLAYGLLFLVGPQNGGLGWVGLLPLISASLYYRWIGAILLTVVNAIAQGGLALIVAAPSGVLVLVGLLTIVYLALGLFLAFISPRIATFVGPRKASRSQKETTREELERRRAIYELISALSATLNYQRVLEMALDLSANTLRGVKTSADKLKSAALLFTADEGPSPEIQISTSRRFIPSDTRLALPGTSGMIGRAIDEGVAQLSQDISSDPEISRFVSLNDCRSAYCIPLRTGLEAYGILLYAHPDEDFFSPDCIEVLEIAGNQAMIALQNARLYRDLEQEKERMMEIQEEARKKMARDLHDGPTQSVSAIAMRVNFARRLLERDPKAAAEELFKIEELARRTTKEIRHMLFTLRPLVLESQGLLAALESMAEKMRETYNQNVIIQADQRMVDALEMNKQAVIFYIAEEAVNNARKHAQATHIWVRLKKLRDDLSLLEIEDDGIGFNVGAVDSAYENRGSLGMVNMRERTELVNGILRLDSAVGRGTRIQVVIPLTEEAADQIRRGI
ncbi:MAG: histidine kinase [Chloroflexota bacterium]